MATFTDNTPRQFGKYIPPVDSALYAGALAKRDVEYKEGAQRVQGLIDNVAGLPVMRDVDKEYLQGFVNSLTSEVNSMVGTDWADQGSVNKLQNYASKLASDDKVQDAVSATMKVKQEWNMMKSAKEQAIKDGKNVTANEEYFKSQLNEWMQDPEVGKQFNGQYVPFMDVDKYTMDMFAKLHPDVKVMQQLDGTQGYYSWDKTEQSYKRMPPTQVRRELEGLVKTNPQMATQLSINGWYNNHSLEPLDLEQGVKNRFDKNVIPAIQKDLDSLKLEKSSATGEYKTQLEKQIKDYEDLLSQTKTQRDDLIKQATTGSDHVRTYLHKEDWLDTLSSMIGYTEDSDKRMKNDALYAIQNQKRVDAQWAKALKSGAKEKTEKGPNNLFIQKPLDLSAQHPYLFDEFNQRISEIDEELKDTKLQFMHDKLDNDGHANDFFNAVQTTNDENGVKRSTRYSVKADKATQIDAEYNRLYAKYKSGNWENADELGSPLDFRTIEHFKGVEETQTRQKLMKEASLRATTAFNEFAKSDVNVSRYNQAIKNINVPDQYVNINGKRVLVTKTDLINATRVAKRLNNGVTNDNTPFGGLTTGGLGMTKSGPERRTDAEKDILRQYNMDEDKVAAVMQVLRQNIGNAPLLGGLSTVSSTDDKVIATKNNFLNNYVRNFQTAIGVNQMLIDTSKPELAKGVMDVVETMAANINSTGDNAYDDDIQEILSKFTEGKGVSVVLEHDEKKNSFQVGVSNPNVEGGRFQYIPITAQNASVLGWNTQEQRPMHDAEVRLELNSNGSSSKTGVGYPESMYFTEVNNHIFRYEIKKDAQGYVVAMYVKDKTSNSEPIRQEIPAYFDDMGQVQAALPELVKRFSSALGGQDYTPFQDNPIPQQNPMMQGATPQAQQNNYTNNNQR